MNRVQLSLVIKDDEMYNELVRPLRESHNIDEFIIDLMTKYYKYEAVRQTIAEPTKYLPEKKEVSFEGIYATLDMMEYYNHEGKNILSDGKDNLSNIMTKAEDLQKQQKAMLPITVNDINSDEEVVCLFIIREKSMYKK